MFVEVLDMNEREVVCRSTAIWCSAWVMSTAWKLGVTSATVASMALRRRSTSTEALSLS
ncbi:hypothetical protein [Micromonospora chokoriensis]